MPLFVRISATEWMEWSGKETWDMPQSIKLAHILPDLGVDLLDVSSGGNTFEQKIQLHPYYQVDLAGEIRKSLKKAGKEMLIGAVGLITTAEMARDIVQSTASYTIGEDPEQGDWANPMAGSTDECEDQSKADVVIIARQFLVSIGIPLLHYTIGLPANCTGLPHFGFKYANIAKREPEFCLRVAQHLGVQVKWPNQYLRAGWPDSQKV